MNAQNVDYTELYLSLHRDEGSTVYITRHGVPIVILDEHIDRTIPQQWLKFGKTGKFIDHAYWGISEQNGLWYVEGIMNRWTSERGALQGAVAIFGLDTTLLSHLKQQVREAIAASPYHRNQLKNA